MTDPYQILGVSRDATDIEIKNAYRNLARKYHPDNYANNPDMAALAEEKMKEINEAYDRIMQERKGGGSGDQRNTYAEIRNMINARRMSEAEAALARIPVAERTADWHFLEALVLMHRGFSNDAMRELNTACQMDPNNVEYQRARQMFAQNAAGFGGNYGGGGSVHRSGGCNGCDVCQGLICADCCCECMGGDLISCC